MDGRLAPQIVISTIAATLPLWLAYFAWKRRPATGATLFAVWMLATAQWTLAHALEINSVDPALRLFWVRFQFLGMVIAPAAWLAFVLEYTGNESWLNRRNLTLLGFIPAATFFLALTNDLHGLIWQEINLDKAVPLQALDVTYGAWFWVHLTFSISCVLIACGYFSANWRQGSTTVSRWQILFLQFGVLVPWLGSILYLMGDNIVDWTAVGFVISSLILLYYTLRFRLFDLTPVAHRAVVDSMKDGTILLDPQDRIVDVNPAAEQLLHQPAAAVLGRSIADVWPDLQDCLLQESELTWEGPEAPRFFEVTLSALYDWRKEPRGHLLVLHDITERKEMEALRADLTRTMVHDLRAPISNSLFALEMLKGGLVEDGSADNHQLLEMTFANTEKTLQLVNEILELSRMENDRTMSVDFTAVSLSDLVCNILQSQFPRAFEKQIQLSCDIPNTLPMAWADPRLVERVIQNLVDNSIKFSPEGGRISVSARVASMKEHLPGTADYLLVRVKDNGPGISPAFQEHIFQKFVTGRSQESGTGLGLAFCKMAIAAHGERIWVESEPGQGSDFIFTLAISRHLSPYLNHPPTDKLTAAFQKGGLLN